MLLPRIVKDSTYEQLTPKLKSLKDLEFATVGCPWLGKCIEYMCLCTYCQTNVIGWRTYFPVTIKRGFEYFKF